ncbi:MAG: hypothetical protein C4525_10615 [Desulfarculus sp.]|jgi:MFS superfamily sulfate permease-like transporter|nr:MAG: hypothetical protein C4525_10615 [Desulfarculus sp.]
MSKERWLQWLLLALTAGLLLFLKWLHYGVTHYNIFLLILLAWTLLLLVAFRALGGSRAAQKDEPATPSEG